MTAKEAIKSLVGMGEPSSEEPKPPTELDLHVAKTQANVTYGYMILFGGAVAALIFIRKQVDPQLNTLLVTLLSVLGTIMVQQSSFWFARQRTAGVPSDQTNSVGPVQNVEKMTVEAAKKDPDPATT